MLQFAAMESLQVDVAKLTADIERLEAEHAAAEDAVRAAVSDAEQIADRLAALRAVMDALRTYAVSTPDDRNSLPPGPLAGLSGTAAAEEYVKSQHGAVVKLEAAYEEMVRLGYAGTLNSISVAFGNMVKAGQIEREKRGVYRFPLIDLDHAPTPPSPSVEGAARFGKVLDAVGRTGELSRGGG